jgi:heterodisulfide reductase subunit A
MNDNDKKVKLTINDKVVEVDEGTTILQAAKVLDIEIPTLCYHPVLEPYAACRVCVVETKVGDKVDIVTSCNTKVREGMVVNTESENALSARRTNIEMLMAQAPAAEVVQELAKKMGIEKTRFAIKDPDEKCILCGLCVRTCEQIVGAEAISFVGRGINRKVAPPFDEPSEACIGCTACAFFCPTECITSEDLYGRKIIHSEMTLGPTTAVRVPIRQAVPMVPFIDEEACIHFKTGECKICAKICPKEAIDHDAQDEEIELDVGTVILASGFKSFDASRIPAYGYGKFNNVITALEFERLVNASGPTGGKIKLANGEEPKAVGIVHCVGSRDENYNEYCSRVCCMYSLKFAKFIRGRVSDVTDMALSDDEEGKLIIRVEDTLIGLVRRIPVDMVILSTGLEPGIDQNEIAKIFNISCSQDTFFLEGHPKLAPVSTFSDGIFLAGACQSPKDIPDTVAQAGAAAAEALSLADRGTFALEPITAEIDEELCAGCQLCVSLCPFTAITYDKDKGVSVINDALCKGCGTCVSACPCGASQQKHFRDAQIFAEIEGIFVE